ncbi:MAG: lysylphosphatidylglycerol synthase transmembrane domain-containing protein [Nocardioidaceae bacterium]
MSGQQPGMGSPAGGADAPVGLPGEALGKRPGPWSVVLKVASAAISGGLIVLLFVAVIPKVADFEEVGESLKSMRPITILMLFVAAVLIRVFLTQAYAVLTPEVNFRQALIAREASSAVSNAIPGPSGTASQFVILHSWGVGAERFAGATVAVSVCTNVLIFAAPGGFFVVWAMLGMPAGAGGADPWIFGLVAAGVSTLAITVVAAVARSARFAHLLGRTCERLANPVRRVFGKGPIDTWADQAVELRSNLAAELRLSGIRLLIYTTAGYLLNGLLLVACIWACGASQEQLPMSLGLLLYSVGRIATVIQITPGGVGVVEIVYSAVYISVLGEDAHDFVVGGVLVYRALTYLLPIVTGAFAYVIWRLMRRHERRDAAASEPAGG